MVFFTKPADQGRFNAAVHELLRLRFNGPAFIDGEWDPYDTLDYLEFRMGLKIIPTLRQDGSLFRVHNKFVCFTDVNVIISPSFADVADNRIE